MTSNTSCIFPGCTKRQFAKREFCAECWNKVPRKQRYKLMPTYRGRHPRRPLLTLAYARARREFLSTFSLKPKPLNTVEFA